VFPTEMISTFFPAASGEKDRGTVASVAGGRRGCGLTRLVRALRESGRKQGASRAGVLERSPVGEGRAQRGEAISIRLADLGWASVRSIEAVLTSRLGNLVSTTTEDGRGCVATAL
jgi:hypothetical protein